MNVAHRNGSYDISFAALSEALQSVPESSWFVTDALVHELYGDRLPASRVMVLPPGEATKSMEFFSLCLEQLAGSGAKRSDAVVAFGGGVVGDLAGFVAASYMRGVNLIQIPTTLLAQVDSSVGGKVGIDLRAGKNLAGAFYPPSAVYICKELLGTLDERQFRNGMAEVWKYGFIADAGLVDTLRSGILHKRSSNLEEVIRDCVAIKARIVGEDEFERTGLRAILNFGHTIGHAIEHYLKYETLLHGEAISIGMCLEAKLGERLVITAPGTADLVRSCLETQGLPTEADAAWEPRALVRSMQADKKRTAAGLSFSLLEGMGRCKLVGGVRDEDVEQVIGLR